MRRAAIPTVPSRRAYVGLGANLGDPQRTICRAIDTLAGSASTTGWAVSRLYRSAPQNATGPDYVNAVMQLDTTMTADELLSALQALEQRHGRRRPYQNAPRTLDLDLILYDKVQMNAAHLTLPHPRLHERAFVLKPLHDLCPSLAIPGRGKLSDLLDAVADQVLEPITGHCQPGDRDGSP